MISIYEYVNIETGEPEYVGQSCRPHIRKLEHHYLTSYLSFDRQLQSNPQNYRFCIILDGLTQEDANYWETYYIVAHKTWWGFGKYNYLLSRYADEDARKRALSVALKGKKKPKGFGEKVGQRRRGAKASEETKRRISQNHYDCTGERNSFFGRKHTLEARKKMAASRWKIKPSDGPSVIKLHNEGYGFKSIGKIIGCSESSARRYYKSIHPNIILSSANLGSRNGMFGKFHSAEAKIKMSQAQLRVIASKAAKALAAASS